MENNDIVNKLDKLKKEGKIIGNWRNTNDNNPFFQCLICGKRKRLISSDGEQLTYPIYFNGECFENICNECSNEIPKDLLDK